MVINGFVLGSCLSIAVSLCMVLVVFLVIGDDHPRLQSEIRPLTASVGIFLGMTAISAGSFYSLIIGHATRLWFQALMWCGLFCTGWYYWP